MLYRSSAAADRLGIGKTKLFELLQSGELASVTIGTNRLVADLDLAGYEARLRHGAPTTTESVDSARSSTRPDAWT